MEKQSSFDIYLSGGKNGEIRNSKPAWQSLGRATLSGRRGGGDWVDGDRERENFVISYKFVPSLAETKRRSASVQVD
ncbi:hypothetical protein QYF36_016965 [Acer negundo]|nr:hypothetical protein QYF36_016965 [Acer negundo]